MAKFERKVVLITGASSGMGKEMALLLAREGHFVYGAARRVDRMRDLEEAGGHAVALDVTHEATVRRWLSDRAFDGLVMSQVKGAR